VIADVAALAVVVWMLLTVPLLVAGFIRLRGWRRRNWRTAAAWAGAWLAGCALMAVAVIVAGTASEAPSLGWGAGELPIFASWLALGARLNRILSTPAHSRNLPETSDRAGKLPGGTR